MKLSISEARKRLPELVRQVRKDAGAKVEITVRDEVVAELRGPLPEPEPGSCGEKTARSYAQVAKAPGTEDPRFQPGQAIPVWICRSKTVVALPSRLFCDTSFFYACLDSNDANHERAEELNDEAAKRSHLPDRSIRQLSIIFLLRGGLNNQALPRSSVVTIRCPLRPRHPRAPSQSP
jgi:antitoxin (DNA-binding transcriptional repressor) of toxin-antitoxin stability system